MAQKKLKQENYVTIADFMVASLERDLADFTAIYNTKKLMNCLIR